MAQMFAVKHDGFNYITTDKELIIQRVLQGYRVEAIAFFRESLTGGRPVRVISYGSAGHLLSY